MIGELSWTIYDLRRLWMRSPAMIEALGVEPSESMTPGGWYHNGRQRPWGYCAIDQTIMVEISNCDALLDQFMPCQSAFFSLAIAKIPNFKHELSFMGRNNFLSPQSVEGANSVCNSLQDIHKRHDLHWFPIQVSVVLQVMTTLSILVPIIQRRGCLPSQRPTSLTLEVTQLRRQWFRAIPILDMRSWTWQISKLTKIDKRVCTLYQENRWLYTYYHAIDVKHSICSVPIVHFPPS